MRMTLFTLLAASILLTGCASSNNPEISIASNQHVVISNADLAQHLNFGRGRMQRFSDKVQANVSITNLTANTKVLNYRFDWYDSQGLEVYLNAADHSTWHSVQIQPEQTLTLDCEILNPRAEKFRVSIK